MSTLALVVPHGTTAWLGPHMQFSMKLQRRKSNDIFLTKQHKIFYNLFLDLSQTQEIIIIFLKNKFLKNIFIKTLRFSWNKRSLRWQLLFSFFFFFSKKAAVFKIIYCLCLLLDGICEEIHNLKWKINLIIGERFFC